MSIPTRLNRKPSSLPEHCERRYKTLDLALKKNRYQPDALIEVLHKAQESFGYLEEDVLRYIARAMKLPLSRVYGVASFYHLFELEASGVHRCVVCLGTACYVKGASEILSRLESKLQIKVGNTTGDGQMSLFSARCLGACGIAPAVVFDDEIVGQQSSESVLHQIQPWLASTSEAV